MSDQARTDANSSLLTASDLTGATLEAAYKEYYTDRTGPLTATLIEAIAYLPLASLSTSWTSIISNLSAADPNTYLPSDYTAELRAGYTAQYGSIVGSLRSSSEGAVEVMANSMGTIQVASQRTLSRGHVRPASSSILSGVVVDPRYGSHPFDSDVLMMGLEWNARLVQTSAMQELSPSPDASLVSGDEGQLQAVVSAGLNTEFHPCGTTAMMPRESRGVVDASLRVYGVQNLRMVDFGIVPLIPSAHMQAVVYAVAEKASDIMKSQQSGAATAVATAGNGTGRRRRQALGSQ